MAQRGWATWRAATDRALYGDDGFYRRADGGPAEHFRTSVHVSPVFARAVLSIARAAGLGLVVDVGGGRGELARTLHGLDPSLELLVVEVAPRPADLPDAVGWSDVLPADVVGLVVANEWLDNVPVDVVEQTADGLRLVEVDRSGRERLGGPPSDRDADWLAEWWPLGEAGARAEVGHPRDEAWASVVSSVRGGLAIAVDYAHTRADRPYAGSLAGYRRGRQVPPVPDGSCDVTAHVALDACAAAGTAAGATATLLTTQRKALHALGIRAATPSPDLAARDPVAYLSAVVSASSVAELTGPGGLGGFGWLVQAVGTDLPEPLASA